MTDVNVSFVNISANNDDNKNNSTLGQNFGQNLAKIAKLTCYHPCILPILGS